MLNTSFQSTRPARGATVAQSLLLSVELTFQSTRPARGATNLTTVARSEKMDFNPRAPRGARPVVEYGKQYGFKFQSTRPARGATFRSTQIQMTTSISIHAPREGRDLRRSPDAEDVLRFQSTRPARGATAKVNKFLCTFLQKRHGFQIFLRKTLPFKAFCRLQIGKNFSICGANRCGNFCELLLRTIRSSVLPEGRSACSQNAQFYSHTFSRDNRNADCLFPDP